MRTTSNSPSRYLVSYGAGLAVTLGIFLVIPLSQLVGNWAPPEPELLPTPVQIEPPRGELRLDPQQSEDQPPPEDAEDIPELMDFNRFEIGVSAEGFQFPDTWLAIDPKSFLDDAILSMDESAEPPRRLSLGRLEYPQTMKRTKRDGKVTCLVHVSAEGRVTDIVVKSTTDSRFNEAAAKALRQARFTPCQQDGRPIASKVLQTISFIYPR